MICYHVMAIVTTTINQQNEPLEQSNLTIPMNEKQLLEKHFSKYMNNYIDFEKNDIKYFEDYIIKYVDGDGTMWYYEYTIDDWEYISQYVVLSTNFILRFIDKLDIMRIAQYQKIDLNAFIKIIHKIEFDSCENSKKHLCAYCINHYYDNDYKPYYYIDSNQPYNYYTFHQIYCYHIDHQKFCYCTDHEKFWNNISRYQKLTKNFIDEYKNFLNWNIIFEHQQIDEKFIKTYNSYINYTSLGKNKKIADDVLCKFVNWRNIDIDIKKRYVEKYYETFDMDGKIWIKCYKSVKNDYSSIHCGKKWVDVITNKTNKHIDFIYDKINVPYITSCNFDPKEENSFGFGCWTYEMASKYAEDNKIKDYKIINVIIPLESSCMIFDGKLRSSEMVIVKK